MKLLLDQDKMVVGMVNEDFVLPDGFSVVDEGDESICGWASTSGRIFYHSYSIDDSQ